jgi:phage terminase small subunit
MRILLVFTSLLLVVTMLTACGSDAPSTPVETFKTYVKAIRAKDTKAMKVLLSDATLKMHDQEAKAQNISVDEIIKRETLLAEGQRNVEYRNEKIDGDKATLQVKSSGFWQTIPFVREDGVWKIDKQGVADQMLQDMDESNRKLNEMINNSNANPSEPSN